MGPGTIWSPVRLSDWLLLSCQADCLVSVVWLSCGQADCSLAVRLAALLLGDPMVSGSNYTHAETGILALVWPPTGLALPTGQWAVTLSTNATVWKEVPCVHYTGCLSWSEGHVFIVLICDPILPQFVIPNWRCERINESYINFIAERGKYHLILFITPSVRDILLAIFVCVSSSSCIHLLLNLGN